MNIPNPRTIAFLFTNTKDGTIAKIKLGEDADTALHGLNHISGAGYFVIHPTSLRGLAYVPHLLRYDFVLTQDHLLLGFVVSTLARLLGRKTKWMYFTMTASILAKHHAAHPLRLFLLKLFWRSYACIIYITSKQRQDLIRLGVLPGRLVFIPFSIDAEFFAAAKAAAEENFILSVGRDAGRDYPTLIKAAERTEKKIVITCARRNIPEGTAIPPNVTVRYDAGVLDVRSLYARAKLVAVVSKDFDRSDGSDCSGQTVILEALAAGKAVVATSRPWIADYLTPGEDLVVVPAGNPEALARAINELAGDPTRRAALVAKGRAKVLERYTTKAFTASLMKLMDYLS